MTTPGYYNAQCYHSNSQMQTLSSYEVAVTKSGENRSATQELQCNASKCVCVQQLTAFQSSYEIQVQSYTRQGVLIAKGITRVGK